MKYPVLNILLIEDDPDDQFLMRELLKEKNQFYGRVNLRKAVYLKQAIDMLNGNPDIDLIILDLNLADSYGLESFEALKQEFFELPPAIIVSGLNDLETSFKAIEKGASDYLVKGDLTPASLNAAIRKALDRVRK